MESGREYRIEDWYLDTCEVCGAPSYVGAGIKRPQCSSPNCALFMPPPIEEWRARQKEQADKHIEHKDNDNDSDGIYFQEVDDLYFHDDED